jgi:hypothetical protein
MSKHPVARLNFTLEEGEPMLYCELKDGRWWKRIAKRGPGERWTNLDPHYAVRGSEPGGDRDRLIIDYTPEVMSRYATSVRNAETGEYYWFESSSAERVVPGEVTEIPPDRTLHGPFVTQAECLEDERHTFETEFGAPPLRTNLLEH